jgi:nucleotide-binding universal stress UspA family protein
MGRDHILPGFFSWVHKKFKTPSGSLLVSAALIIIMLLLLPIEDIASSAGVMFLILFIFVNIALIHIRRKNPKRLKGYKSPLFPLFPVLAIISQSVLVLVMFTYSPKSFFLSLLWIGMGLSIYFGYSRLKEKEEVGPKVIVEEKELAHKDFRLVVGIEEKEEVLPLMNLAIPIAKEKDGEIFVTHVIPLPPQTPLNVGKQFVESKKKMLKTADELGNKNKIPVSYNIRASHKIYQGILDSVHENKGSVLILGSGDIKPRGRIIGSILDPLLQESPCDIGVLKKKDAGKIKKILVPTSGGPNAKLAFTWGSWIAKHTKGKMTLLYIIRDEAERDKANEWLAKTKKDVQYEKERIEEKIVIGKNIVKTLQQESEGHDLILIGASRVGLWKRIRFGTIPEKLTRSSNVSVLVVNKFEGTILSWFRRFIAG